jgi:hypothetical protein
MTKKHLIAVAAILAMRIDACEKLLDEDLPYADEIRGYLYAYQQVARDFAHIAAEDNPRFDRDRFLQACGA